MPLTLPWIIFSSGMSAAADYTFLRSEAVPDDAFEAVRDILLAFHPQSQIGSFPETEPVFLYFPAGAAFSALAKIDLDRTRTGRRALIYRVALWQNDLPPDALESADVFAAIDAAGKSGARAPVSLSMESTSLANPQPFATWWEHGKVAPPVFVHVVHAPRPRASRESLRAASLALQERLVEFTRDTRLGQHGDRLGDDPMLHAILAQCRRLTDQLGALAPPDGVKEADLADTATVIAEDLWRLFVEHEVVAQADSLADAICAWADIERTPRVVPQLSGRSSEPAAKATGFWRRWTR